MQTELLSRKSEAIDNPIETIYFGGGTPSVLTDAEIEQFISSIDRNFDLKSDAEITLEANPDDLNADRIRSLAQGPVNRLSVGVQSFEDDQLSWMNRSHSAAQALKSLELVKENFSNFSIDLIYGIPGSTLDVWAKNLNTALEFAPPHISTYALTVEPATALQVHIDKGISATPDEDRAEEDFNYLIDALTSRGYAHYEISNFGKPGYYSQNNTAYWLGKSYIGIGPAAHSFNGSARRWNVSNNIKYIRALESGASYFEAEQLSLKDRYNELVMTGLRTEWGVSLQRIQQEFGQAFQDYLLKLAQPHIEQQFLFLEGERLFLSKKGKFLADGIASELFMVNLK
jgi:oxygen-independent coproporphyrinogen-3 oxidase